MRWFYFKQAVEAFNQRQYWRMSVSMHADIGDCLIKQ
jgi:hypothetical protein